ncbi:MAG: GspE/PulE family protein [Burkholderiales bacterium]
MSSVAIGELEARFGADPEPLLRHLADAFRLPSMRLEGLRQSAPAFDLVPYAEALRRRCVVVRTTQGDLCAVLGDPYDGATQDWLENRIRQPFAYCLAHHGEIAAYLAEQEEGLRAMDELAPQTEAGSVQDEAQDVSIESIAATDSPVVRLVNSTLHDALKAGASDIHLETGGAGLAVKYRIDGVLGLVKTVRGTDFAEQAISRVKVMAELDIAERRIPQDGRFRARNGGREIDLRVSIMPSVFGEDAVLRILDKRALSDQLKGLTLERLGFDAGIASELRRISAEPHGMLLVTGPTGSGKTTTLYSVISEVNKGRDKIVTIEDPVEYQLPGVLQIPVNEKKGLTFARGLRSILRHDPDRIMVGEIRDAETAEIAVQSALTGHLVFTSVHANNVFDVIGRFQHMGVDPFSLASALNAVMAQRLVRVICTACAAKGCAQCRGTGYRGRRAIAELMILNDDLKELIASRAPTRRLKEVARASGTGSLREAALAMSKAGHTTQEEVDRVTSSSA